MPVFEAWRVLCVLGLVGASLGANLNEVEYEGNYADNYENEISQDQQEGETPSPCQAVEFTRWDKLFIALEDSHMRQNMLLNGLEQCCGQVASLGTRVDTLTTQGTCQRCLPGLESACRAQAEQTNVKLKQGLLKLQDEAADRERRLNVTLHRLLHSSHEENARLKRLEEDWANQEMGHKPTTSRGGLGSAFGTTEPPFLLKERDETTTTTTTTNTTPLDDADVDADVQRALVAIATELQRVHLQLNRVIRQQAGSLGMARGDT